MRLPVMNDHRQLQHPGKPELLPEYRLLDIGVGIPFDVIQADFTVRDNLIVRISCKVGEVVERLLCDLTGIVRMYTDSGPDGAVAPGNRDCGTGTLQVDSDRQYSPDPVCKSPLDNEIEIVSVVCHVEVAMTVND